MTCTGHHWLVALWTMIGANYWSVTASSMGSLYCDLGATPWRWSLVLFRFVVKDETCVWHKYSTIMGTGIMHKFIQVMEEQKSEWLNIKELEPLRYMRYVDQCFMDSMGCNLKGLGLHMRWIRPRSYYHWKVAELHQLQHCPHLQGLPVPPGPMECPSVLQQQQRPNRWGAMAPSATRNSGAGGLTTSGGSSESSWMEGWVGDSASWDDLVTHAEASPGACKRKKTDAGQHTPGCPFPLASEEARKEVMGIIHECAAGLEPSQKNIA